MVDIYMRAMKIIAECAQHSRGDGSHFGKPWMASHMIAAELGIGRRFVLNARLYCPMLREAWLASLSNIPRHNRGKFRTQGGGS